MAGEISFQKSDFEGLGLDAEILETVFQEVSKQNTLIDNFILVGKQLQSLITVEIGHNTKGGFASIGGSSSASNKNKANQTRIQAIMTIGTSYVFNLRTFLLDDSILFMLGREINTEEGQTLLETKTYSQDSILQSLRANLSSGAMMLSHQLLELENALSITSDLDESQVWNQIQEAASTEMDYEASKSSKYQMAVVNKTGKKRRVYHGTNIDDWVYFRFTGKNHEIHKYYGENANNLKYFNNGWLYEWFQAKIAIQGGLEDLKSQMQKNKLHPLAALIGNIDSVEGIKGGDFSLGEGQGSAQAKFGNEQIITFSNIMKVIEQLNTILFNFKMDQQDKNPKEIARQLFDLFIDESLQSTLSRTVDQTVDRIAEIITNNYKG